MGFRRIHQFCFVAHGITKPSQDQRVFTTEDRFNVNRLLSVAWEQNSPHFSGERKKEECSKSFLKKWDMPRSNSILWELDESQAKRSTNPKFSISVWRPMAYTNHYRKTSRTWVELMSHSIQTRYTAACMSLPKSGERYKFWHLFHMLYKYYACAHCTMLDNGASFHNNFGLHVYFSFRESEHESVSQYR